MLKIILHNYTLINIPILYTIQRYKKIGGFKNEKNNI